MQDLRLVAANERGTHLVLRSAAGHKFLVCIDERLRAAVRGDRPSAGGTDAAAGGELRPREIQARIRAGASEEEIARAFRVPVDRVRRFSGPVLAEREHFAELAQRTAVRRTGLEARPAPLAETVDERLSAAGVDPAGLVWDAWRSEDGRWVVQAAYSQGELTRVARFLYDPRARSVVADDAEARWLTDGSAEPPAAAAFVPRIAPAPGPDPRRTEDGVDAPAGPVQMEVPIPLVEASAGQSAVAATRAAAERGTGTDGGPPPPNRRPRRASVPSWDDIVFGTRRPG